MERFGTFHLSNWKSRFRPLSAKTMYSGSGVFFFVVNENETETKRKRSLNGFFEMRFQFSRNLLTNKVLSNGKNCFRLNAFFFTKTFFGTF